MDSDEQAEAGAPRPQLDDAEYRALGAFRRAIREFLAFSEEAARANGLTAQQHQALLAVRSHEGDEPITVGELADSLLIRSHTAVGLVHRLAERDLIRRRVSAGDRRRVLVELTDHGAAILEAISLMNLGQLNRTERILAGILRTTRRLARGGAWARR